MDGNFKGEKLNMYGIIYLIENKVNGKRYIGQTIQGLKKRKMEHINAARQGLDLHLYKAIRFHGEEKFSFSEIDSAEDKTSLDEKEKYYILIYKTYNKNYGYNKSLGGEGGIPTAETREKLSLARRGEKNHMWGKPSVRRRKIICEQNLIVYDSIMECAESLGLRSANIAMALKGKARSVQGYSFLYYNEDTVYEKKEKHLQYQPIVCEQTNHLYDSMSECARTLNISSAGILRCLHNKQEFYKGYSFKYYQEGMEMIKKPFFVKVKKVRIRKKKERKPRGKRIICLQSLKVFASLKKAASELNVKPSSISNNLRGVLPHIQGYTFNYYQDGYNYTKKRKVSDRSRIRIVCEQTGVEFKSITECASKMNISSSAITFNLQGKCKHVKGYTFVQSNAFKETKCKVLNLREKVKVRCIQNNIEYPSVSECARNLGICHSKILSILKGQRRSTHGYTFERV